MQNLSGYRRVLIIGLLLMTGVMVGCRPGSTTSDTGSLPGSGTSTPLATTPGAPVLTVGSGGQTPENDPLEELTGYELAAANAGEAVYSGYSCTIAQVGCACEMPVIERATFTFSEYDILHYRFEGSGYAATWEMERAGPNQWSYQMPLFGEGGVYQGELLVLLTFTEQGYIYTLAGEIGGEWVACPDVAFRRLKSATPKP